MTAVFRQTCAHIRMVKTVDCGKAFVKAFANCIQSVQESFTLCIPNVIRHRQKEDEQGWMFWSGQGLSALLQAKANGQKDMIRPGTELLKGAPICEMQSD